MMFCNTKQSASENEIFKTLFVNIPIYPIYIAPVAATLFSLHSKFSTWALSFHYQRTNREPFSTSPAAENNLNFVQFYFYLTTHQNRFEDKYSAGSMDFM
jgi:hypothetical protein